MLNQKRTVLAQAGKDNTAFRFSRILSMFLMASMLIGLALSMTPGRVVFAAGPFTVNTLNDTQDLVNGDENCADGSGNCSLRAALEEANASGGTTIINLPAGTFNLTLGDLIAGDQPNANITIHGAGAANTIIHQTQAGLTIFVVNFNVDPNVVFNLDHLTVSGGSENEDDPDGFGGNGGAILAGGSITAPGNVVSISNVSFTGNYCSPLSLVSNAGCSGGAISMTGGGNLIVDASTFTGNEAAKNAGTGSGGAIYFDNGGNPGSVTITNSTFTNNIAHNSGGQGGAVRLAGGNGTTYTVNNNTFTLNSATQNGGALYLSLGNLTANFNRIVGNTSNSGSGLFVANNSISTGAATNNWWGCNGGPGATGCNTAVLGAGSGGSLTANPWIVLKTTASPSTVNVGQPSTLTTSFLQNSNNQPLTAGQVSRLIGLPLTWTNAVHGVFSSPAATIQADGTATATLTNDNSCNNSSGQAQVDQVVNGDATATATVTVQCSDLTALKSNNVSGSTIFPAGWTWTIHVANGGAGYADFPNGAAILTDNLPNSGLSYGTASISAPAGLTGTVNCSIASNNLSCAANGPVRLNAGGSFDVVFTVTPTQGGQYINPRGAGSCSVDPSLTVVESGEANNTCSNSVTVNQPPSITSANSTTFTVGTLGSFTVTTTPGFPLATAITRTGALPGGVTFIDNGNGTATLAGTPGAGSGGVYSLSIQAANGVSSFVTQTFTLTVNEAPTITSGNSATFTVNSAGSFNVLTSGYPGGGSIVITQTGSLPSGVNFTDNQDGTATLAGTPAAGSGGTYPITIQASNGILPDASQSFTLSVNEAPSITSANSVAFKVGTLSTFTVTTSGFPIPALSESGALPVGVSFVDNGDGTASLGGTPGAGTGGTYSLTIKAANGVSPDASQSFSLTVNEAPSITSLDHATFTVGAAGSFSVTAGGFPAGGSIAISETGGLPSGVNFTDNQDGTATLAGTPAVGSGGTYPITIQASNGILPDASQSFTLTINETPSITSANSATFTTGTPGSFTVTASGFPIPALSESGALPGGVSFVDNGDGTAELSGTPGAGTGGIYTITIKAANGVSPDASQSFTLTVNEPPSITSLDHATFTAGAAGSFSVTASGFPSGGSIAITELGSLPSGVTFTDNQDGTATLAGTPAAGTGGVYPFTISASNGVSPNASQSFTLTVNEGLAITSLDHATFNVGAAGTFAVTTSGFPLPTLTQTGSLPSGVTFVDHGDGTATLSGTPDSGTSGAYPLVLTAHNGAGPDAVQSFTLTVNNLIIFTSLDTATFSVASPGTFSVSVNGVPTPALSETGGLPSGVTFVDNHDGTATLSGTPLLGTVGSYPLTLKAVNGASPDATQAFTLTVAKAIPTLQIGLAPNPTVFGQAATFSASVASALGVPTGTVQFSLDGTNTGSPQALNSGSASLNLSSMAVGTHTIAVQYSGDANFTSGTSVSAQQQVNKASTTTAFTVEYGPSIFGKPIDVRISVTAVSPGAGIPGGLVAFYDGPTLLGTGNLDANGTIVLSAVAITANGNHSFQVTYSGDSNFTASTQTRTVLIPWRILLTPVFLTTH